MGGLADSIAQSCRQLGVDFLLDAPVARIETSGGAVTGISLEDGRSFLIGAGQAMRSDTVMQEVILTDPILTLGAETGAPKRMNAKRGVYNEKTRILRLSGDVRIDNGSGQRVATNDALVDTRSGRITGNDGLVGDGRRAHVRHTCTWDVVVLGLEQPRPDRRRNHGHQPVVAGADRKRIGLDKCFGRMAAHVWPSRTGDVVVLGSRR
jgi:hypothetical protein